MLGGEEAPHTVTAAAAAASPPPHNIHPNAIKRIHNHNTTAAHIASRPHLVEVERVEQVGQLAVLLLLLQHHVVLHEAVQRELGLVVDVDLHRLFWMIDDCRRLTTTIDDVDGAAQQYVPYVLYAFVLGREREGEGGRGAKHRGGDGGGGGGFGSDGQLQRDGRHARGAESTRGESRRGGRLAGAADGRRRCREADDDDAAGTMAGAARGSQKEPRTACRRRPRGVVTNGAQSAGVAQRAVARWLPQWAASTRRAEGRGALPGAFDGEEAHTTDGQRGRAKHCPPPVLLAPNCRVCMQTTIKAAAPPRSQKKQRRGAEQASGALASAQQEAEGECSKGRGGQQQQPEALPPRSTLPLLGAAPPKNNGRGWLLTVSAPLCKAPLRPARAAP